MPFQGPALLLPALPAPPKAYLRQGRAGLGMALEEQKRVRQGLRRNRPGKVMAMKKAGQGFAGRGMAGHMRGGQGRAGQSRAGL